MEREPEIDPEGATESAAAFEPTSAATVTDPAAARAQARGPANRELTGRTLAHFRVEERLGRGGMGEVYRATDLALDRPVALKILAEEIAGDPDLRERFYREARAQARIQHPNVCHIYFIGEEEGLLFFAMEYVDGETLQERLAREGSVPAGEAVELCRMAALGLREAHLSGFTHRDVKPSNLMIDRHGAIKILDFGIVKKAAAGGDAALTAEGGALIGTPLYMAPEQARGEEVDFRADIYALGATLHHLIAGGPPHAGDTPMAVVSKHLADPRPRLPRSKRRGESAALDALLDRMMAKRPEDRFPDYESLRGALEALSPVRSRPAGFWVRTFAVCIDLLVAMLLAIPIPIVASILSDNKVLLGVLEDAALALSALVYSVLAHARWGRTLGKALLELTVIPVDGEGPPGLRRSSVRFLVQWGFLYLAVALVHLLRTAGEAVGVSEALIPGAILLLLIHGARASRRMQKRPMWDLAARTRVIYTR